MTQATDNSRLRVAYQWTREDANSLQKILMQPGKPAYQVNVKTARTAIRYYGICMVLSIVTAAAFATPKGASASDTYFGVFAGIAVFVLLGLLAVYMTTRASKGRLSEWEKLSGRDKLPTSCHASINEEGFTIDSVVSRTTLKWGEFDSVETNEQLIVILSGGVYGYGVPVRAFSTASDATAFYKQLLERHENAKAIVRSR